MIFNIDRSLGEVFNDEVQSMTGNPRSQSEGDDMLDHKASKYETLRRIHNCWTSTECCNLIPTLTSNHFLSYKTKVTKWYLYARYLYVQSIMREKGWPHEFEICAIRALHVERAFGLTVAIFQLLLFFKQGHHIFTLYKLCSYFQSENQ